MTITDFTSIDQYRDVESQNYYQIIQVRGHTPEEAFEIIHARSRDDGRTPMVWDESETGGFTSGTPWLGINANHSYINAESEMADPHSVRAYFKRLIALRKELPLVQGVRFVSWRRAATRSSPTSGRWETSALWCNATSRATSSTL